MQNEKNENLSDTLTKSKGISPWPRKTSDPLSE